MAFSTKLLGWIVFANCLGSATAISLTLNLNLSLVNLTTDINTSDASPCSCTTVPCPLVGQNFLAIPGGGFGIYGYIERYGRPVLSFMQASITFANLDLGTATTTCTRAYARSLDNAEQLCDAGHVIANRLGGPGNQPLNIWPQSPAVNRGVWAQFEGAIHDCVKNGAIAHLAFDFFYGDEKYRPTQLRAAVEYEGGFCPDVIKTFEN